MKQLSLFLVCCMYTTFCAAQDVIMRQNGSVSVPYYTTTTTLAQVITASAAGDTIYLPGGNFDLGAGLTINKKLHIIGVGHYNGASNVAGITVLRGIVSITNLASGGSLTGIQFQSNATNGYLQFGNLSSGTNQHVANYTFTRCKMDYSVALGYTTTPPVANNIIFRECILKQYISGNETTNVKFEHCVHTIIQGFTNGTVVIENCTGMNNDYGYNLFYGCSNLIINNSFISSPYNNGANIYTNCVFNSVATTSATGSNNLFFINQSLSSLFTGFTGNSAYGTPTDNADDYHYQSTSPALMDINGNPFPEVGIYGGNIPYKEKAIPFNPHIKNFTISGSNVTVEVKAESH